MIRGTIFDMDGLLFDTEQTAFRVLQEMAHAIGYRVDRDMYARMVGMSRQGMCTSLSREFGSQFPADDFVDRFHRTLASHFSHNPPDLKRGALDILHDLLRREIRLAVATSSHRTVAHHYMQHACILSLFDVIVCGEDVEHGKPAPDIYLKTAQQMGLSPPQCLVFEDSAHGVQSAAQAGMRVVMIPDIQPPTARNQQQTCMIADSLIEACRTLPTLLSTDDRPSQSIL